MVEVYRRSRTGECIIPKTMTQLYTALSQTLLIRYLQEHPVHGKTKWKIHNFSDLPSDVYEHFLQLSEVAYCSITNDQKLVFSSEDLPRSLETLGFMQSVPELYVNESFSHNFLHLTIQEYLAAVYITHLSPEEQLKLFEEFGDTLLEVVMRFVAGLTKFSGIPSVSIRALLGHPTEYADNCPQYYVKCDYTVNPDRVNWMFETQDPDTINAILGNGNTIKFEDDYLMPFDFYCLGYCIAHSHCQWKLASGDISEELVTMLTAGGSALHISKQNTSIVGMNCHFKTPEVMKYLFSTLSLHIRVELQELTGGLFESSSLTRILRSSPSLKVVECLFTEFTVGDLSELCDLLASTSNTLEIITIRSNNDDYDDDWSDSYVTIEGTYLHTSISVDIVISDVDDVSIALSVLNENSSLGLHLTAVRMCEDIDGDLVCRALHDTTTLKILEYIGTKDAAAIIQLIHNNKSLERVWMDCDIDSEGVCHLAQALCENTTLRELDLQSQFYFYYHNSNGTKGAMALAQLIHNKSLEQVIVRSCEPGSEWGHISSDQTSILSVPWNTIGQGGVVALAAMLHTNTSLQSLDLNDAPIGEEGIRKVLEAMTVNSTLQELTLPQECKVYAESLPEFSRVSSRVSFGSSNQ